MPYVLGLVMGSTTTTAAISRLRGRRWAAPEVVQLGARSAGIPTVLQLAASGSFTVGDAVSPHGRVVRGFTRRIGDDVPVLAGGEPVQPQTLTAVLAAWVVERVQEAEGERPDLIVVGHPAHWGPYRRKILTEALREIGLLDSALLPAPVLAAESVARSGAGGDLLAVHTLGGSGYDAAVVRGTQPMGYEVVGALPGVEPLGGTDFDEALVAHVRDQAGEALRGADPADPQLRLAMFGLRHECVLAKERLSTAAETDVTFRVPQRTGAVREERVTVTRAAFADLIRPSVQLTVDNVARAVRTCGLRPRQLDGVVLIGGSANIPLVAELVGAEFPGAVILPDDPRTAVAVGAAVAARQLLTGESPPRPAPPPAPVERQVSAPPPPPPSRAVTVPPDEDDDEPADGPPPRPPVTVTPLDLPSTKQPNRRGRRGGKGMLTFGILGAQRLLAIVVGIMLWMGPATDDPRHAAWDPAAPAGTADGVAPGAGAPGGRR